MGDEREQSEFNMAVSYLNRLNALFYAADDASMNLDAHGWFHALMGLYRELSTELKPEEIAEIDTLKTSVHNQLQQNLQRNARLRRQELTPELYDALHQFELRLRRVCKEAGLQNKMVNSALGALK